MADLVAILKQTGDSQSLAFRSPMCHQPFSFLYFGIVVAVICQWQVLDGVLKTSSH